MTSSSPELQLGRHAIRVIMMDTSRVIDRWHTPWVWIRIREQACHALTT